MLILERLSGESILINDNIKITVYYTKGQQIKLGVDAPRHITVIRKELLNNKVPELTKNAKNNHNPDKHNKHSVKIKTKKRKNVILPTI
jgi:carbon storage regulator